MESIDIYRLLEIRQELMATRSFLEYHLNMDKHIIKIEAILKEINEILKKEDQI